MVLTGVRQVGQQSPVVHGIIIVTVGGAQPQADLLVKVAAHLEDGSRSCSRMAPQPEIPVLASQDHELTGSAKGEAPCI
jgi:hypothetical protein